MPTDIPITIEIFPNFGVPPLAGTKWLIYGFKGFGEITETGTTWNFSDGNKVKDNPNRWSGEYQSLTSSNDRIAIAAKYNVGPTRFYELVFVLPHYFIVAEGTVKGQEMSYEVVFIGVRQNL
jgi:hypothetical protein